MTEPREHRLAAKVRAANVPLWRLRLALGGSPCEGSLSRKLRGLEPLPPELAARIETALGELRATGKAKRAAPACRCAGTCQDEGNCACDNTPGAAPAVGM